ncbi:hypothetical protein GCM10009789_36300 [Kribbella sancticallisti]|uniref:Antitoxin n=1 Tax=Kribbella sancticallisti TaxID=460087 RepID=A0ABP4PIL8_9ACTN
MTSDDEHDRAITGETGARGPLWVPAAEASAPTDQLSAEAEAEDTAALREWDALNAAGQAFTVPHKEVRRRLGLD